MKKTSKTEQTGYTAADKDIEEIVLPKFEEEAATVEASIETAPAEKKTRKSRKADKKEEEQKEKVSRATVGFSWSGLMTREQLSKQLGECGYSVREKAEGFDLSDTDSIHEELKKYTALYPELPFLYNALPENVKVKKSTRVKGHMFDIADAEGNYLCTVYRISYKPKFEQRINRRAMIEVNKKKKAVQRVKRENPIEEIKNPEVSPLEETMSFIAEEEPKL